MHVPTGTKLHLQIPHPAWHVYVCQHGVCGRRVAASNLCARAVLLKLEHFVQIALQQRVAGAQGGIYLAGVPVLAWCVHASAEVPESMPYHQERGWPQLQHWAQCFSNDCRPRNTQALHTPDATLRQTAHAFKPTVMSKATSCYNPPSCRPQFTLNHADTKFGI